MDELISIVLPVYNGERYLRESIESVIGQTYKNWELIIIDDCSTDDTPGIIHEYLCKDSRIHYYRNEKNLRLPSSLNRGFSLTKGLYLTWTSDDNRFRPSALEKMLAVLKKNGAVQLVYASYQIIDENGNQLGKIMADPKGKQHILGSNIVGACFLYSREAMEKTGLYDPKLLLVEDFDYWQRMFTKVNTMYLPEILYDYRWHSASLTSTKKEKEFGIVLEKMLKKNRPAFGRLDSEAHYSYISALYHARKKQGGLNPYFLEYYFWHISHKVRMIVNKQ